jgi:hypothetical protein
MVMQLIEFESLWLGIQIVEQCVLGPLNVHHKLPGWVLADLLTSAQEGRCTPIDDYVAGLLTSQAQPSIHSGLVQRARPDGVRIEVLWPKETSHDGVSGNAPLAEDDGPTHCNAAEKNQAGLGCEHSHGEC